MRRPGKTVQKMINDGVHRKSIRKCPIHAPVIELMTKHFEINKKVQISQVLRELDYKLVQDSIRWDYARELAAEALNIPLSWVFSLNNDAFLAENAEKLEKEPQLYLASGRMRATAGYAIIDPQHPGLSMASCAADVNRALKMLNKAMTKTEQHNCIMADGNPRFIIDLGIDIGQINSVMAVMGKGVREIISRDNDNDADAADDVAQAA